MQTAAFEDYAAGRISKQEYLSRKKEAARQQEEAAAQYAELTDQMAALRSETCTASDLGHYVFVEKLTREMLEVLVREIRISGKDSMECSVLLFHTRTINESAEGDNIFHYLYVP